MASPHSANDNDAPVEYRINMLKTISFIGMGVGLDIFDFVLGITGVGEIADEVVDAVADFAIPTTAWMYGIPLAGRKANQRLFTILTMEIAKMVPFLNILPEYTYETWKLIALTREEDREMAAEAAKKAQEQTAQQTQQAVRAMQIRNTEIQRRNQEEEETEMLRYQQMENANDTADEEEDRIAA